jgi:hypothetical protein
MKNLNKEHIRLSDFIASNRGDLVSDILSNTKDLDMTYSDGNFFRLAIDNNNHSVTRDLLSYFESNQLSQCKPSSIKYILLKDKIKNILEVAVEDVELSQGMKGILSPYIDFEGSERDSDFLEDETHIDNNFILKEQVKSVTIKKSYSMNDLHNSTFDNSKEYTFAVKSWNELSNNSSEEKLPFLEKLLEDLHDTHVVENKECCSDLSGHSHNTDEF